MCILNYIIAFKRLMNSSSEESPTSPHIIPAFQIMDPVAERSMRVNNKKRESQESNENSSSRSKKSLPPKVTLREGPIKGS
jgi:hypothetical protein